MPFLSLMGGKWSVFLGTLKPMYLGARVDAQRQAPAVNDRIEDSLVTAHASGA